jgi:hypothetical protein
MDRMVVKVTKDHGRPKAPGEARIYLTHRSGGKGNW